MLFILMLENVFYCYIHFIVKLFFLPETVYVALQFASVTQMPRLQICTIKLDSLLNL